MRVKRSFYLLFGLPLLLALLSACAGRGDSLAPMITITEPQSSAVRAGSELTIIGYAMDDDGVTSIRVDGTELLEASALAGERGKKLINFGFRPQQVREGQWRSEMTVTDSDNRVTTKTLTLEVDGTPPTVEITGIEALDGGFNRISGIARDDDQVSSIRVGESPLSFTPAPQVSFNFDTAGDINVTVTDAAGNVTDYAP